MGGANSAVGNALTPEDLRGAWVIDCAGDMPEDYRATATLWLYRVFPDLEDAPPSWPRIDALARSVARCLQGMPPDGDAADHPDAPPPRLYVLCTQGLNRSGLITGRILCELGLPGDDAVRTLVRHRPGSLNNMTFARLVRGRGTPEDDRRRA